METRGGDGEWAGGDTDKYENGGRRKEGGEGLWESDVGSHPFFLLLALFPIIPLGITLPPSLVSRQR